MIQYRQNLFSWVWPHNSGITLVELMSKYSLWQIYVAVTITKSKKNPKWGPKSHYMLRNRMQHNFLPWLQVAAATLKALSKSVAAAWLAEKERELQPLGGYSLAVNTACWRPQPLLETSCQREKSGSVRADGSRQSVVSLFLMCRITPAAETLHPKEKKKKIPALFKSSAAQSPF